jgi:hypothetical protein
VVDVDMLGHVRCQRIDHMLNGVFVVFIHGSGSTLAIVNVVDQLVEVDRALGCTTHGNILGFGGR